MYQEKPRAYCPNVYTVPEGPWRPALSSASEVFRNHAYFESAFSGCRSQWHRSFSKLQTMRTESVM